MKNTPTQSVFKRLFDICFALALIILVLSWLVPFLWVLIKLDSKGPLFFVQQREGKNGIPFYCYKFRSLPVDAPPHTPGQALQTSVSRLGRILRSSGIDELPQALNILKATPGYVIIPAPTIDIFDTLLSVESLS